ncbi:MAG: hypothetical protein ABI467_13110 [Kofleriaceae bacterium]
MSLLITKLSTPKADTRLATGTRGGDIHLIDTATGAEVGRVDLVSDKPRSLWWSADGKHLMIDTEHRFRITLDRS